MSGDPDFIPIQSQPDFIPATKATAPPAPKQDPGFLDKDISLDSYKNATLSGVQSIGRAGRSAIQGFGHAIAHPLDTLSETVKSVGDLPSQVARVPGAIHDINQSADPLGTYAKVGQETAAQGGVQAGIGAVTEGAVGGIARIPKSVAAAPVRALSRTTEGVINSSPARYVRGVGKLFTPADDARKMIRIPGRDLGLELPSRLGAPFPERPLPAIMQARGLQTGGRAFEDPSAALARIPVTAAEPDTALAIASPKGKLGGRLILTPEEIQQAEQVQKIATKRASERGMQYAGGMRPSGGKITAP